MGSMKPLKFQSNGMGQQSVAMYLMMIKGDLPKVDVSIFADPGREKTETYKYLDWMIEYGKNNNGPEIIVDRTKNLYKDIMNQENSTGQRVASIPAFTESGGMIRRQCTNEYKIQPVNKAIAKSQDREGKTLLKGTEIWFGISVDEMRRMNKPNRPNTTYVYPFCGYKTTRNKIEPLEWGRKMSRSDINSWMNENGFDIPPKSSCVFCPFQNNNNWQELKENHPEDYKDAIKVDRAIRDMTKRGLHDKIYLHRSLKPLDEIDSFTGNQMDLFNTEGEDCFGYCGT